MTRMTARSIWALCLATFTAAPVHAAPPQIWFGPMQDHYDPAAKTISWSYYDFPALLGPEAQWEHAARNAHAMMFNSTHVTEGFTHSGNPSLPAIKAMLTRTGLKAGGGGAVMYTDGLCEGAGTEGMSSDKDFAREAYFTTRDWHDAGMPMDYFVMDGPYGFGAIATQDKCHFTPEDVGRRAATTMKKIRDLYPNIIVIDADGPGAALPAAWLPGYHRFLIAFAKEYGAPIDYLNMDLAWADKWHTGYHWPVAAAEIANDMHAHGMKVSLIIHAEDQDWDPDVTPPSPLANPRTDMTAAYWMAAVRKHIDLVKQHAIPLDAIDIESWMKFPRRNLPESDPLAWTSIVDYAHDVLNPGK
jgi:hypothetical protein